MTRFVIKPDIFGHYRIVPEDVAYLERENILEGKPNIYAQAGIFIRRNEFPDLIKQLQEWYDGGIYADSDRRSKESTD